MSIARSGVRRAGSRETPRSKSSPDGFTFIEGPLWRPPGVLWFSDVVGNVVRQWSPDGKVTRDPAARRLRRQQPAGRRLHRTQRHDRRQGRRRAALPARQSPHRAHRRDMKVTTLVDQFEGKKLNSPNDLVYPIRRVALLHRSAVRTAEAGRGSGQGTDVQRRLPAGQRQAAGARQGSDPAERHRLLARREERSTSPIPTRSAKVWMRYDVAAGRDGQQRPRVRRRDGGERQTACPTA